MNNPYPQNITRHGFRHENGLVSVIAYAIAQPTERFNFYFYNFGDNITYVINLLNSQKTLWWMKCEAMKAKKSLAYIYYVTF